MGQAPSFGEDSLIGERIGRLFRHRTPKPDARMPAAVGLFGGPKNGGESLVRSGLEQANGFEPLTPTLARFTSDRERDFRSDRPSVNVMRIILARSNGVIVGSVPPI